MNKKVDIIEDTKLECSIAFFSNINFELESGYKLKQFKVAFKTFGSLNAKKDNAILICHALTGDQYVSGFNPITKKVSPINPIEYGKIIVGIINRE